MHDEIIEHGMSYCTPISTALASSRSRASSGIESIEDARLLPGGSISNHQALDRSRRPCLDIKSVARVVDGITT